MQIALSQGFYQAKSLIADAQRSLNLFPEKNPSDSPFPFTAYLTPGLTLLGAVGANGCRCLYTAGNGDLYGCYANTVYYIDSSWNFTALGTVGGSGLVSMSDNLLVVAVVDGTANGWYIDMTSRVMTQIVDPAFYGADIVDYLDTFMIFNRPATNQWYISPSEWTGNAVSGSVTGGTISGGARYSDGTFPSVPLTGGLGTGAVASITVSGGVVTGVAIGVGGIGYVIGDVLSAAPTSLGGGVTGGNITAGSLYTNGTYANVPLTGGSGSGAIATIVVAGAVVTTVTITSPGIDYVVGDVLSASPSTIGGTGSGFLYTLTSVNAGGGGFTYTVTSIGPGNDSFDPLAIASITGASDELQTLKVMHRELWLLGVRKASEVWYDSGAADFPFQALPGVFVEHGCVAKYSIAKADLSIFWVGQDKEGDLVIFEGTQYQAKRISTFAIENAIQQYPTVLDAVGFTYQQEGHVFYQLTFPSADKTWVYDVATELWHERAWIDDNGIEHRHRAIQGAFAYGMNVVGDWQNGNLYLYDVTNFTDNGQPISRIRDFPHVLNSGKRLCVNQVLGAMATGVAPGTSVLQSPAVGLAVSYDGGNSFGNTVQTVPTGSAGQYNTQPQWRQVGMARDFVFRLVWSSNYFTACMGLWLEATPAQT